MRYSSPQSPGIGASVSRAARNLRAVFVGEREREQPQRVVDVRALAQPRARRSRPPRRVGRECSGWRRLRSTRRAGPPPALPRPARAAAHPSRRHAQEAPVLHHRPRAGAFPVRLGLAEPTSRSTIRRPRCRRPAAGHRWPRSTAPAAKPRADRAARTTPGSRPLRSRWFSPFASARCRRWSARDGESGPPASVPAGRNRVSSQLGSA